MEHSIILTGTSKSEIDLFISLAKKVGLKVKTISKEEKEDAALLFLMNTERTKKTVNKEEFLKSLRK